MIKIKLTTEQKGIIIAISFVVDFGLGLLYSYLDNPIWRSFCIVNIVVWSILGLISFFSFYTFHVRYNAEPELMKDKLKLEEQITILEARNRQLEREAKQIEKESTL